MANAFMEAKQFSGRVHGERRALTAKKVTALTSAIWLSGICASPMAMAQQVVASGSTLAASGTIDTGTTTSVPGYGLYATNGGVIEGSSSLTVITRGYGANPVAADTGGQIFLSDGSSISGSGSTAYGLYADGANSGITATNTIVSMTGPSSDGAYVRNNGTITVNGGALAGGTFGAFAFTGGTFSATDATITSSGSTAESAGVEANTDSHVTLTRGSVTNSGIGPGLYVLDDGANASLPIGALTATGTTVQAVGDGALVDSGKMVLNDVSITTTGVGGIGAIAGQDAVLIMQGGSVTTLADQASGLESNDVVDADHVTVSTMGSGSIGATGQFGGVMRLSNSGITTAGASGIGVVAYYDGAQVAVTGSRISTTGDSAHGALAEVGGLVTLADSVVGTSGAGAFGLSAVLGGTLNQPSQVIASGSTVTTTGLNSYGVVLQGLASIGMTNSSVSTSGVGADALYAAYGEGVFTGLVENANSATLTGSSLTSAQAAGLEVLSQLNVSLQQGSSITGHTNAMEVVDGAALELLADQSTLTGGATLGVGATSSVTLQNGSQWTMTAPVAVTDLSLDASTVRLGAAGVTVTTATPIVLGAGGGTFDTNGFDTALAPSLSGAGAFYKAGAGTLALTAANTYAGDTIVNGGTLALQGAGDVSQSSSVSLAQAGSAFNIAGLAGASTAIQNFSGVAGSQLVLGGKTLVVTQGVDSEFAGDIAASDGSFVKNGAGALTLSGATGYTGTTTLNAGELILDGARGGAQLTSDVVGVAGTTLMLSHGATLTGSVDPTDLSIDIPSVWNITANSTVGTLTLGGRAGFVAPAEPFITGRTLRVTNLVGNGGTIGLYAALGNSSSSSDQVVIDGGSATGLTHLAVHNAGGLGDQTTGDGIRVVGAVNGGVTEAKAFDLSGRVLAGPYEYTLQRGGTNAANDWFLTSDLAPQDAAGSSGSSGSSDSSGSGPGNAGNSGNGQPNYRAETSLYSDLSSQALGYGEAVLGTFHERMGADGVSDVGNDRSVWSRALGQSDRDTGARNGIAGHEVASRVDLTGLQVGGDLYAESNGDRRTSVGVYAATGESQGTVSQAGTNTLKAYSLAVYGTWLDGKGAYLDAVVQGTHYDIRSQSVNAMTLTTTAKGVAASLEAGKAYELRKGLGLEPQAQLIYQTVDTGRAHDQAGGVSFDRAGQGQLRVGARLNRALDINGPTPSAVWVGANLLQSAGGGARTKFATVTQGNVSFDNQNVGTRLGLQAGIDALLARNVWLNAHFGVERSIDGGHLTSVSGQVGLKVAF